VIRRLSWALVLAASLAAAATAHGLQATSGTDTATAASKQSQAKGNRVLVMRLEGVISPVTAELLGSAVDRAEREGYRALVIEIDTPGGLETSMREMVKRILSSRIPIIAWVSPSGARAASAGVFVTMAADVAAMAPGTNIGAATPINLQGPMDSTLARKVTSDAAAFARTVAAQRGRSEAWAERAVREAVAASETEAVALHVVDFVAASLPELLAKADGRAWHRGDEQHVLAVKDLPADRIESGLRERLLQILTDPSIAYILLLLGFYGLLFELQSPGAILPGVVGGICLVLAFFSLSTLPVNYAGVALIVLALGFFIAEVKVMSHGVLAVGGVIAMLLGSLILFPADQVRLPWTLIGGATLITAVFFLLVIGAGLRAQRRRVQTGGEALVGAHAAVVSRLAPEGMVRVAGELWRAISDTAAEPGSEVEITGVDKLTLHVRAHRSSKLEG
jgi:membrane-bound serine protease (ClpP class)